jgi:hypothetical protein
MPRRIRKAGALRRRVYVRLNECEYAGLVRLGVLSTRCVGEETRVAIQRALHQRQVTDREFERWWDAECLRLAREEMQG